ncbi:hypothetical protein [Thalassospira mesophila]|uniref:hypothetical protein n=1 Tax=Thalassospira mesophila TaxID=1293891 RepID=UPI000A200F01|nr:hypothetical protein [Thalassospira mesophila]
MVSLNLNNSAQGRASSLVSLQQTGQTASVLNIAASKSRSAASAISVNAQSMAARLTQSSVNAGNSNAATTGNTATSTRSVGEAVSSQMSKMLHLTTGGGEAINDASRRMNRDALIVLAMLGIPPAKAREMADQLTGAANADGIGKAIGTGGNFAASMAQSGQAASGFSLVASNVELQFSQTNLQASSTSNGSSTRISINDLQVRVSQIRMEVSNVTQQDPLILDLDGNGIDITALRDGAIFDLDGDGTASQAAWVTGNDALLALDKNNNGKIDDGRELFGDQNGAADGFAELATYDDNSDGKIDAQDKVFSSLILLHADGSQSSLQDEGIASIRLSAITPLSQRLVGGTLAAEGQFVRDDGGVGKVGEVLLDTEA